MSAKLKPLFVFAFILMAFAFKTPVQKQINIKESSIIWKGKKVIGSSKNGTIDLKEGFFEFEDDILTGGQFVVDMTSISASDMKEKYKLKLERHLKSDDFFGVKNFPTAALKINKVSKKSDSYEVTGDLTIKGITNSITFDLYMKNNTSTALIEIDRSKFDIRYGSGSFFDNLGDKTISDIIELNIVLKH